MRDALTVLSVAFPFARVGPDAVGGAEQVLSSLDRALSSGGHRSLVIAQQGSRVSGTLIGLPIFDPNEPAARSRAHAAWRRAIDDTIRSERVDVVHLHGLDFDAYAPESGTAPVLATLHLPPALYGRRAFDGRLTLVCVSLSQRLACPAGAPRVRTIPNGVDLDAFEPRHAKGRYALALGRICPEKGYDLAIDAAQRAGVPLVLAGRVFPYETHRRYFAERIAPRLGARSGFLGPVGPRVRRRLLSRARCLLVPSLVDETSSLVAMEALASATPVIAFDRGALGEVIEHGKTGFVVRDLDAMVRAMGELGAIDPAACRRAAELRFSASRMHESYVDLYRELAHVRAREAA